MDINCLCPACADKPKCNASEWLKKNVSLKAEVARLGSMGNDLGCMILENESLKAEVEHQKELLNRQMEINDEINAEHKAEVERLKGALREISTEDIGCWSAEENDRPDSCDQMKLIAEEALQDKESETFFGGGTIDFNPQDKEVE